LSTSQLVVVSACVLFATAMTVGSVTYWLGRRSLYVLVAEQEREIATLLEAFWNDGDEGIKTLDGERTL
jgi:hypothetical protein